MSPTVCIPVQDTSRPDHVKVRLAYSTHETTTEAALMLADHLGLPGPYGEDVCILVHRTKVFSGLFTYAPFLQILKEAGFVPQDAKLQDYKIEMEDQTTLAYVME
jgi:hypothetical protein